MCVSAATRPTRPPRRLSPAEFAREHRGGTVYRMRHDALLYNATTALPTVHSVLVNVPVVGRVRPTTDLISSPLRVFLIGDSMDDVLADQVRVRQLKDDVYRVD